MKRGLALILALMMVMTSLYALAEVFNLKSGSKGSAVADLQVKLDHLGYEVGKLDGDFGRKTSNALGTFQKAHGLPQSGLVDEATRMALVNDYEIATQPRLGGFASLAPELEIDKDVHSYAVFVEDASWEEANVRSIEMGGHLVSIDSMEEYAAIQSEIMVQGQMDAAFWIGARRDRHSGHSGESFFWVGEDGVPYVNPIDFDGAFGGYRPWALGMPSYWSSQNEAKLYVRMVYSADEGRWVWEDTVGRAEDGRPMGYVVEFDDAQTAAAAIASHNAGMYETAAIGGAMGYRLEILGLEANSVLSRITAESICQIQYNFWTPDHTQLLFSVWDYVEGGLNNRLTRVAVPKENYNVLAKNFIIEGILYHHAFAPQADASRTNTLELRADYNYLPETDAACTPWIVCERYKTGNEAQEPIRPSRRNSSSTSDSGNGDIPASIPGNNNAGSGTIEAPGQNIISEPVNPNNSIALEPELTTLSGQLMNESTGLPISNQVVTLESQGVTYSVTTDENGCFRFENVPRVKGELSYIEHGITSRLTIDAAQKNQNILMPAKNVVYTEFYGYEVIDEAALLAAYGEFLSKCQTGEYGPADAYYWFKGQSTHIIVDENIAGFDPENPSQPSFEFPKGTIFNIERDLSMVPVVGEITELNLNDVDLALLLLLANNHQLVFYTPEKAVYKVRVGCYVAPNQPMEGKGYYDEVMLAKGVMSISSVIRERMSYVGASMEDLNKPETKKEHRHKKDEDDEDEEDDEEYYWEDYGHDYEEGYRDDYEEDYGDYYEDDYYDDGDDYSGDDDESDDGE